MLGCGSLCSRGSWGRTKRSLGTSNSSKVGPGISDPCACFSKRHLAHRSLCTLCGKQVVHRRLRALRLLTRALHGCCVPCMDAAHISGTGSKRACSTWTAQLRVGQVWRHLREPSPPTSRTRSTSSPCFGTGAERCVCASPNQWMCARRGARAAPMEACHTHCAGNFKDQHQSCMPKFKPSVLTPTGPENKGKKKYAGSKYSLHQLRSRYCIDDVTWPRAHMWFVRTGGCLSTRAAASFQARQAELNCWPCSPRLQMQKRCCPG